MEMDKRILYGFTVLLLACSLAFAFQRTALSDSDYASLVSSGFKLESIQPLGIALAVLLPVAVYAAYLLIFKADPFHALIAALLLAVSGALTYSLFTLSPVLAIALGKSYALPESLKLAGGPLSIGLIALASYKKDLPSAVLAALGLLAVPFAPGLSAVFLALAVPSGLLVLIGDDKHSSKALVACVFVFAFQAAYSGNDVQALVQALFLAALAYVALSIHNIKKEEVYAAVLVIFAFWAISSLYAVTLKTDGIVGAAEINSFSSLSGYGGKVGVLDNPNSFAYYSGHQPVLMNASALLKKGSELPDRVVLSSRSLSLAFAERPVVFSFRGIGTTTNGDEVAIFSNARYALYMRVRGSEPLVEDAQVLDTRSGESSSIPFTKVKSLSANFTSIENMAVNVQGIEETPLYFLLFGSGTQFNANATIIKVR